MLQIKKKVFIWWVAFTLLIGFVIFLILTIFEKIETVYNITANTEIITCYSKDKPMSRINLFDAKLITLSEDTDLNFQEDIISTSFRGSVELNDSVKIKLERIAYGALLIEVVRPTGGPVAYLREFGKMDSHLVSVNDNLFIEVNKIDSLLHSNASIVIPFTGKVELGKSIAVESDGEYSLLLREGDITMTGIVKSNESSFVAGHERLFLGDRLRFEDDNSIGIASINTDPAIQVSYRAIADEAYILKPGPRGVEGGYRFSATIFSRFKYDRFFQGFSLFIGGVITIMSIGNFFFSHVINFKNQKP